MTDVFFKTFAMVFLAELGDKTQLATMGNASEAGGKGVWAVFIGSALALVLSSAIAAFIGGKLNEHVSRKTIQIAAGCLFIFFGALSLYGAFKK